MASKLNETAENLYDVLSRVDPAIFGLVKEVADSGILELPFESEDLSNCVIRHAAASSVAAMAGGILPGAASVVAVAVGAGAIWRMYIKICSIIGVRLGKNKLKTIASAVVTNIVTQLAGIFAMETAASFLPGAGVVICGIGNFAVVYFAGLIFLNILTKLFQADVDVDAVNMEDWKRSVKETAKSVDTKKLYKEAKETFKNMRKDGSLHTAGSGVDISGEDETQ